MKKEKRSLTQQEYEALPEHEKAKWVKIFRRGIGGPNMPKHQTCPNCGRPVKRTIKFPTGASYECSCGLLARVSSKVEAPLSK